MVRCLEVLINRHAMCRSAVLGLWFAFGAASSFGQLNARPASVVLLATLESLSMGVEPAHTPGEMAATVAPRIAVTASWALPANLTTLHLVELRHGTGVSDSGFTIWSQSSGDSNRPSMRAERLSVPSGATPEAHPNSKMEEEPVFLLIEAL